MKPIITNILLTKEAFEEYLQKQQQDIAAQHGMSVEEWKQAVTNGEVVNQPSPTTNKKDDTPNRG